MAWRIMIGASDTGWRKGEDILGLDAKDAHWIEAPDNVVPGYARKRYAREDEAASAARWLRAAGFSASTEFVADDADGAR